MKTIRVEFEVSDVAAQERKAKARKKARRTSEASRRRNRG